eukprot:CAMPEP_0178537196 /NCGR_PEP_ID=MMETSP0696-20121128/36471_1 /TAXON_ID=265572 /ORGANISM="Extubocellulus spinifer, Strain CCMP396" /LENGTH=58 /DNA_ID=CAMNT_0020169429 /DNA_START=414 /DNA_END=587 /DNA_ORIENTATION=+
MAALNHPIEETGAIHLAVHPIEVVGASGGRNARRRARPQVSMDESDASLDSSSSSDVG